MVKVITDLTNSLARNVWPGQMGVLVDAESRKLASEIEKSLSESKKRISEMLREQTPGSYPEGVTLGMPSNLLNVQAPI